MTALERSLHRWWTMAELKVAEEALVTDSQFCMWDSRRVSAILLKLLKLLVPSKLLMSRS